MHFKDIVFFNRNRKVNTDERIQYHCQDGDILHLSKVFRYYIYWNGQAYQCLYYTNISFETLLYYFLTVNHIITGTSNKNDYYFDGVLQNALIPIQGESRVLEIKCRGGCYFYYDR